MRKRIKKIVIIIAAIVFLVFGVIGLFLPFLQGILFIIVGLVLLSFGFSAVNERLSRHISKSPRLANHYHRLRQKLHKYFE